MVAGALRLYPPFQLLVFRQDDEMQCQPSHPENASLHHAVFVRGSRVWKAWMPRSQIKIRVSAKAKKLAERAVAV